MAYSVDDFSEKEISQEEIEEYYLDSEPSILEPIMPIWGDNELGNNCDKCGETHVILNEQCLCQTCAWEEQENAY